MLAEVFTVDSGAAFEVVFEGDFDREPSRHVGLLHLLHLFDVFFGDIGALQLPEVQGIGDVIECGDRENLQLLPRFEHLQELLLLVDVTWLARLLKDNAHEELDVLAEATNILTLDILEDRVHNQDENVLAIRILLDDLSQCFADTRGKALCVIVAHEAHYLFEGVLPRLPNRKELLCELLAHLLLANF